MCRTSRLDVVSINKSGIKQPCIVRCTSSQALGYGHMANICVWYVQDHTLYIQETLHSKMSPRIH